MMVMLTQPEATVFVALAVITACITPAMAFSCEGRSELQAWHALRGTQSGGSNMADQQLRGADTSEPAAALLARAHLVTGTNRSRVSSVLPLSGARSTNENSSCPPEPHFSALMTSINVTYPGLEAVRTALSTGDNEGACVALADYYRGGQTAIWLRARSIPIPSARMAGGAADGVLRDHYSFYGTAADVPRHPSGALNWSFCPAPQFDSQWMLALQRHTAFETLAQAWNRTGNPVYAQKLNDLIHDWVIYAGQAPVHVNNTFRCNGPPDWLTLDSGIRTSGPWPSAFFLAQQASEFTAVSRLLLVSSTVQHATYLSLKDSQSATANWEATQCHALIITALAFPELLGSMEWLREGSSCIERLMSTGVYPDGVSTEQTAGYDQVALHSYDGILRLFEDAGVAPPSSLRSGVERMYTYLALQMSADGLQVLNGDSDLDSLVSSVRAAALRFDRDDWMYLATRGADGVPPSLHEYGSNGSCMFPWAGQMVMQSRWGATLEDEKIWAWFDVGPYGSSCHSHRDKLHLSVRAYGEHLLVDSGRFGYEGSLAKFRERYGSLTQAHNTLQLDNAEQVGVLGSAQATIPEHSWLITPDSDCAFAEVEFERIKGLAVHMRAVRHLRQHGVLVVVDRVATDRPRNITALWHGHPDSTISISSPSTAHDHQEVQVKGVNASLTLRSATGSCGWQSLDQVTGIGNVATGVGLQGWYSPKYDTKSPAPVAITHTRIDGNATFVWVIATSNTVLPPVVQATVIGSVHDSKRVQVDVAIDGSALGVVDVPVSTCAG
eukprot:COSAG02_NODE_1424_length_12684_cov_13.471116_2_plen_782_part_00